MKYLFPGAAILALGIAAWTRGENWTTPVLAPAVTGDADAGDPFPEAGTGVVRVLAHPEEPVPEVLPAAVGKEGGPPGSSVSGILTARLGSELNLASEQLGRVDAFLRERDEEIRACHQAIREAGVISISDYEWKVAEMKDRWFRRIDGLLDPDQHPRLVALAAGGLFNEGLAFTIEPGMMILD